jgi:hypothetical protein
MFERFVVLLTSLDYYSFRLCTGPLSVLSLCSPNSKVVVFLLPDKVKQKLFCYVWVGAWYSSCPLAAGVRGKRRITQKLNVGLTKAARVTYCNQTCLGFKPGTTESEVQDLTESATHFFSSVPSFLHVFINLTLFKTL